MQKKKNVCYVCFSLLFFCLHHSVHPFSIFSVCVLVGLSANVYFSEECKNLKRRLRVFSVWSLVIFYKLFNVCP